MLAKRYGGGTPTIGKKTEKADANEAARQRVHQEAPQKLCCGERHQSAFAAMRIVFPEEGDLAVAEIDNAMVRDGDPVRVAGQVLEYMLWATERPLGIDDPILPKQSTEEGAESLLLRQWF